MNQLLRHAAAWLVCAALSGTAAAAETAPAAQPIDHFTRMAAIASVAISPSGNRLATIVAGPEGRWRLAVFDLDPLGKPRVVAEFSDADIDSVHWVNDNRLVYEAYQRRSVVGVGGAGTFAINADGTEARQLIAWRPPIADVTTASHISSKLLPYGWWVSSTLDDGSANVVAMKQQRDGAGDVTGYSVVQLDTLTGRTQSISYGFPPNTRNWWLDKAGLPRVLTTESGGREKVWWRPAPDQPWQEMADFDAFGDEGFTPWLVDADGTVLVRSRQNSDTMGLYRLDTQKKRVDPEPVLQLKGFDLSPVAETDGQTHRLVGVHFQTERGQSYWFDAGLERIQRGVDAALPGRTNRLVCGRCESTRFVVVRSSSDRQPGEYYLFDRSKSSLQRIGAERPWIDEATQGRRSFHRVAARDGLELPVYVTHPAGAPADKPLPAVVVVHGGPWVRGSSTEWDAEAQFLASRGYRVLEPEFRGSTGYGARLFKAGWKQWGGRMQDDLVDTVQWAAKQHLVDPARVCVMGGSYGGYAALMAPIATPGVFRCAVSLAGVTDIDLMYSITWSDFTKEWKRYGMPAMIGDREKDAAMLARASPVKRAAEIKVPVLLVHGGEDTRVPMDHARAFLSAARDAGVNIEGLFYADAGHGFVDPRDRTDYLRHVETFLGKWLGAAP